jgi:hypothetical protein
MTDGESGSSGKIDPTPPSPSFMYLLLEVASEIMREAPTAGTQQQAQMLHLLFRLSMRQRVEANSEPNGRVGKRW